MDSCIHSAILPGLFISNAEAASQYSQLRAQRITHVVVVAKSLEPKFPGAFRYLKVDLLDDGTDDLLPHLPSIFSFMDAALAEGGQVLVHCVAGMSRSVSTVVAYVMRRCHLPFELTLQLFRASYPLAEPAQNFREQLKDLEAQVEGSQELGQLGELGCLAPDFWHQQLAAQGGQAVAREGKALWRDYVQEWMALESKELELDVALALQRELVHETTVPLQAECADLELSAYCCVRCQQALFSGKHVLHDCPSGYFVEPMQWMSTSSTQGKLNCACGAKLGHYTWSGQACGCGQWMAPMFSIQKKKVEWKKLQSMEALRSKF